MDGHEPSQHPPPPASFWQRIGAGLMFILLGEGCLPSLLFVAVFTVCFYLAAGFLIGFSHLPSPTAPPSPTDPISRIATGLFYMLGWLRFILVELRKQARTDATPLRHRLNKLFSEPGGPFWWGLSFFGYLLVLLAFPDFAEWPSWLWVYLVLALVLPAILRFLLRRFLRLAH